MATLQIPVTAVDHAEGEVGAPITLVEYGDYECPACGAAYPIVKAVQKHFGEKLEIRLSQFSFDQASPAGGERGRGGRVCRRARTILGDA